MEMVSLCSKQAYAAELKIHMYLSKEKYLYQKQEHPVYCLPVKIDIVFDMKTSCNIGFSRWRCALFIPNRPIQLS
jgi:hypothetical protein